ANRLRTLLVLGSAYLDALMAPNLTVLGSSSRSEGTWNALASAEDIRLVRTELPEPPYAFAVTERRVLLLVSSPCFLGRQVVPTGARAPRIDAKEVRRDVAFWQSPRPGGNPTVQELVVGHAVAQVLVVTLTLEQRGQSVALSPSLSRDCSALTGRQAMSRNVD